MAKVSVMRGIASVEFACPACDTHGRWGTNGVWGRCHGELDGVRCTFRWLRRQDFLVFVRLSDGSTFESNEEFERVVAGNVVTSAAPSLVECLYELLAGIMARPPTMGVIELWSRDERRRAIAWATNEVLADEGVVAAPPRQPRPEFIEEGAATA